MTSAQQWLQGARPRTLPLAIAPILGAAAVTGHSSKLLILALCAFVALALQVGVNYANDYSDGIRGTDEQRASTGGPIRLVGQGLAAPATVKRAALLSFVVAIAFGVAAVLISEQWGLLLIGAAALPAAWFYTGGQKPYGYAGLGEIFVFAFFGLAAVLGTVYAQAISVTAASWFVAAGEGLMSAAVLMANNVRDIPTDVLNHKRTLAVRLGDVPSRWLYSLMVTAGSLGVALAITPAVGWLAVSLLAALALLVAGNLSKTVLRGAQGRELVQVLAGTGRLAFIVSALALGLALLIGN